MNAWIQDARYAARRLWRAPGFSVAVVLTFALGLGASTAVFAVVKGVLLEPLALPSPGDLYTVYSVNQSAGITQASVSAVDLDDWRAARRDIADIGGYLYAPDQTGVDLTGRGAPRRLSAVFITPGFLTALGVQPVAGRLPQENELVRGGPDRVVLLTEGFWAREFGRDAGVIGRALTINREAYNVVGVIPSNLQFPTENAEVFVPFSTIPDSGIPRIRPVRILSVVARAKPGVTESQVTAEMRTITSRLAAAYPDDRAWDSATVEPLVETITGSVKDSLWIVFGAVAFVMAMACVNVASLQFARASHQAGDMSVASALGAERTRLVRQMLAEGLWLSIVGAVCGVALAAGAVALVLRLAGGQLPRASGIHVDGWVLAASALAAIVAGLASSLAPALRATRAAVIRMSAGRGRGMAGAESPRLRAALVVVQIAAAMVLGIGAGLLTRSFAALVAVDAGFRPDHLIAAQFTIDSERHSPPLPAAEAKGIGHGSPFTAYYSAVIARVRQIPGVVSAAAVKDAPFRGNGERNSVQLAGAPVPVGQDPPLATVIHVSDGYFATIGATMADGREYSPADRGDTPFVIVVNEAFANRFFPGRRAVGQRLDYGTVQPEIIGVVKDIRQTSLAAAARPTIYLDNLQNSRVKTTIVARTAGDPAAMAAAIRAAIWSIDADQPIADVFTFDDAMRRSLAAPRFLATLLSTFGMLGVALGVVGLYGLLASWVGRRRKEFGVRMALGATSEGIGASVLKQGAVLGIIGVVLGAVGAAALSKFLAAVLFSVAPLDAMTFALTALVMMSATVAASWLPARRASHADPAESLRA
jgi:predicted permease